MKYAELLWRRFLHDGVKLMSAAPYSKHFIHQGFKFERIMRPDERTVYKVFTTHSSEYSQISSEALLSVLFAADTLEGLGETLEEMNEITTLNKYATMIRTLTAPETNIRDNRVAIERVIRKEEKVKHLKA